MCRVSGSFTHSPCFFFVSTWGSFPDKEQYLGLLLLFLLKVYKKTQVVEIALRSATFFSLSAFDTPCYITFRVYLFIPLLRGTKYLFSALLLNKQLIKGIFLLLCTILGT